MPYTIAQLEAFVSSAHYDSATAGLIARGIPALKAADGELISPGVRRIRGNLCNVHGRYGPCDKAPSGGKKPKGGKRTPRAAKPKQTPAQQAEARNATRQANIDDVAKRMADTDTGLSPSGSKALTAFAQGQQPSPQIGAGLAQMGLAEQASDGSYRMTPTGRAVVSAMAAGDYQRAIDGISRATDAAGKRGQRQTAAQARQAAAAERTRQAEAKRQARAAEQAKPKPAKASAGGSKKPEKEEPAKKPRRAARPPRNNNGGGTAASGSPSATPKPKPAPEPKPEKPTKEQQTADNRGAVRQAMAEADQGLSPSGFDGLIRLSEGATPDAGMARGLIDMGMAELGADGTLRLTSDARTAIAAANRGDAKAAIDAVSRGQERAAKRTTKAAPEHTGVMVALYPDQAAAGKIAAQKGVTEPIDELHLTLAFLGDSTETALATNKAKVIAAVKQWAVEKGKSLKGTVNGLGRFFHSEDDDTNAVFVSPDVPGLPELRQSLVEWIEQSGFDYAQNHGFTPHITVAYVPIDAPTPPIRVETPITFGHVTLAWGDERYDYPLGIAATKAVPSFRVFKDARGQYRWVAQSSTAFQDRDKEIVSTKALADDVARADDEGTYGPLRWWHTPGLDLGDCDFNAMHGRVLIESGTFRTPAIAHKVARAAAGLEISLGFLHLPNEPDADGVFHHIRRFERSLVPRGKASNRFTAFTVKETRMSTFSPEKINRLKEIGLTDEEIAGLSSNANATEKSATDQGVAFKADEPEYPDIIMNGVTYKAFPAKAEAEEAIEAAVETDAVDEMIVEDEPADENALTLSAGDLAAFDERFGALNAKLDAVAAGLDLVKTMSTRMDEFKGMFGQQQATKDAAQAQTAEQIAALTQQVAELTGDQAAVPYRASQASDNVLTEATMLAAAKQLNDPNAADPWADIKLGLGLTRQ